jgi:hypothetical protein
MMLLVLYAHLLATCVALGTIVLADARLLARIAGYAVVIEPPSRFETRSVMASLLILMATGAALIVLGDATQALANPKLRAKLCLVALLVVNAFVLHRVVFPRLQELAPVVRWSGARSWGLALSVGLSNSLWLYCAFLGVARPWNHSVHFDDVMALALLLWLLLAGVIRLVLAYIARHAPDEGLMWMDTMQVSLSGLPRKNPLSLHQHLLGRRKTDKR